MLHCAFLYSGPCGRCARFDDNFRCLLPPAQKYLRNKCSLPADGQLRKLSCLRTKIATGKPGHCNVDSSQSLLPALGVIINNVLGVFLKRTIDRLCFWIPRFWCRRIFTTHVDSFMIRAQHGARAPRIVADQVARD